MPVKALPIATVASLTLFTVLIPAPATAAVTCDGLAATLVGTAGNDTITGTAAADVIAGLDGNDTLIGLAGNDRICGGLGDDTIYGEATQFPPVAIGGNDRIFGQGGNDLLVGDFGLIDLPAVAGVSGGMDTLEGGPGADTIAGEAIEVILDSLGTSTGYGLDTISGGDGPDTVYGDTRDLTVAAGGIFIVENGNDTITLGAGNDTVYGDWENLATPGVVTGSGFRDSIIAGGGADIIYGDGRTGNGSLLPVGTLGFADTIDGGTETDTADAGPGTDACVNVESTSNCP